MSHVILAVHTLTLWGFIRSRWLYLTFLPQADKIVLDFRDDVAVVVTNGAAADIWLGVQHLLTQLLQLGVVTVKVHVSAELLRTLHGAEATVSPQTVFLPLEEEEAKTL